MSAINNSWGDAADIRALSQANLSTSAQADMYRQAISGGNTTISGLKSPDSAISNYRSEFDVRKVENGYIVRVDNKQFIAESVEQVNGIVTTILISKAG
jgi:hypothetical protein